MKVKIIASLMLAAFIQCCFGQTDTNVLAVGDWSATVKDRFYPLRGRLLVYKPRPQTDTEKEQGVWNGARVYVELQLIEKGIYTVNKPTEIFIDSYFPMHAEMRDGYGKLIIGKEAVFTRTDGLVDYPFTVTLPFDSTLRLRASKGAGTQKPDVLLIALPGKSWHIPIGDTNEYFLSATFSPATNHPSALNYHVWQGTLQLPEVKIPH